MARAIGRRREHFFIVPPQPPLLYIYDWTEKMRSLCQAAHIFRLPCIYIRGGWGGTLKNARDDDL